jgi:hypothetical protein
MSRRWLELQQMGKMLYTALSRAVAYRSDSLHGHDTRFYHIMLITGVRVRGHDFSYLFKLASSRGVSGMLSHHDRDMLRCRPAFAVW